MVKVTAALRSRDDWTQEETAAHYRDHHAALVASSSDFTRFIRKYVQNYVIRSEDPIFSGQRHDRAFVTQVWFPSIEDMKAAFSIPQAKYIRADERRFANFDGMVRHYGTEYELFYGDGADDAKAIIRRPKINLFVFRSRKSDLEQSAFQHYWRNERARTLVGHPLFERYVRRYVQTHALVGEKSVRDIGSSDVIDEFSFATRADAAAFWTGYRGAKEFGAVDETMTDRETSWIVLAESRTVCAELIEWMPPQ